MKRILTTVLALMLMLTLCVPVFAAEDTTNTGTITVNNAVKGETYKIYKLATLNSFDEDTGAYSYSVESAWKKFFTEQTSPAYSLFSVSESGYLSKDPTGDTADMPKVAKAALQYALDNKITEVKSITADSTTVVFNELPLGYYLVDTSLGSLCMMDTTDTDMVVNEKNSAPSVDKTVKEDSGDTYIASNDQDLYVANEFRTQVSFKVGAVNYVLHDKMSTGFTFDETSVEVYVGMKSNNGRKLTAGTDYKVSTSCTDDCTFEVEFTKSYCDSLTQNREIYVYYKAALNENAVIGGDGNPNETWLAYGDAQTTTHDTTTTYTYEFDVVKTTVKDEKTSTYTYLPGATFTLYDEETGGNQIKLVKVDEHTYRVAKADETNVVNVIALTDGKAVTIIGLDGGTTYYLQEETAPLGYNKLTARRAVAIESSNLNLTEAGKAADAYADGYGGIQVINRTGTVLPETGGFGTTLFILIGTILVLGTGVLLATKLRMSKISD